MANPQQNACNVKTRMAELQAHPMCRRFASDGVHYRVYFPEGYRLDGARANWKVAGKARALGQLIEACEREWNDARP